MSLPDVVAAKLEAIRTHAAIRATRAQQTLQTVAKAFAAENVDFLLVKGGVLAEHVYGDPAIRPFYDIDILVRDEALDKAERALKSTGLLNACATVKHLRAAGTVASGEPDSFVDEATTRKFYRRFHFHLPFWAPEGTGMIPVELHWHLGRPGYFKVGASAFWESARTLTVAGCEVQTLGVDETIAHLASHALIDGPHLFKLLHLGDVAWSLERWSANVDADRLSRTAARLGLGADFSMAVRALRVLLRFDGPSALADRSSPWQRLCFGLATNEWSIVNLPRSGSNVHLVEELWRDTFWDLARNRWPTSSLRQAFNSVALRKHWRRHQAVSKVGGSGGSA